MSKAMLTSSLSTKFWENARFRIQSQISNGSKTDERDE
jgi:hypothetical protein